MKKFGLRLRILCAVLSFVMIFTVGEGSLSSYADVGATINHRNTSTNVSVTYKANGGTGADIVTSVSTGSSITLAANTFGAPSGHVFDGWSVNGVKRNVGDSITIMSDTDILALWKSTATNVSVTYKANGGTGADIVTSVSTGSSITLAANTFGAPSGHVFDGWSVNGVKKNVGDSITIISDTVILALWKSTATNVSVTYKANGGTGADIVTSVLTGSSITLSANTFGAPSGHVFDGWSVNGVKKNVGDSITITEDTEVLALWITTGGNSSGKKDKEDKEDREIPSPKKDEKSPFVPQSDKGSSKDWSDRVTEDKPVHTLITLKIGSANYQVVENGKTVTKKIDVTPMIYKGRTMIPTRMMAELLGVGVSYNPKAKTTILEYNKNKIELTLGKQTMKINGKERKLSAPMMTKNNRVLLPLTDIQRALKELGLRSEVKWDPSTKSISITK